MGERIESYSFVDEDGVEIKFNYITRWCMCLCNCNDDEIELFEEDSKIPYRLNVPGPDMKWFIKGLIDGDIKPSLTKTKE